MKTSPDTKYYDSKLSNALTPPAVEVCLSRSPAKRLAYTLAGHLSMALAVAGVILPLLPTTPLLLLAAFCYARGSERFYRWLLNHRYLGPYISTWREKGAIPRRTKVGVIALLILVMGSTILFVAPSALIKLLLGAVGAAIVIFLIRIPTAETE